MKSLVAPGLRLSIVLVLLAFPAFAQTAAPFVRPLTDADCDQFGRDVETHWNAGDHSVYEKAMDLRALLRRATGEQQIDDAFWQNFKQGYETSHAAADTGVELKFLRTHTVDGERRILMRRVMRQGGFGYLEFIPARGTSGRIRIVDEFSYTTGEKQSEILKRIMVPILAEKDKPLLLRMFGEKSELLDHMDDFHELSTLTQSGKYREGFAVYDRLPASLQHEKFILALYLKCAEQSDNQRYLAAIDLWQKTYPKDPSIDLLTIDAFVLRKQFPEALADIDRLDKSVGGDPYLDYYRGLLHLLMKDYDKAKADGYRAIDREPTLTRAYDLILDLDVTFERNYSSAVEMLTRLQTAKAISHDKLAQIVESKAGYRRFVASPEYRACRGSPNATTPTSNIAATPAIEANATVA